MKRLVGASARAVATLEFPLDAIYLWLDLRKEGLGHYEKTKRKATAFSKLEKRIRNAFALGVETEKKEVSTAPRSGEFRQSSFDSTFSFHIAVHEELSKWHGCK